MTRPNRTMLANLGFADPDKGKTHDLMCNFIVEHADDIRRLLFHEPGGSAHTEMPISKGNGQYKTTIGYFDVVLYGSAIYGKDGLPKTEEEKRQLHQWKDEDDEEIDRLEKEMDRAKEIMDSYICNSSNSNIWNRCRLNDDEFKKHDAARDAFNDARNAFSKYRNRFRSRHANVVICVECKTKVKSIGDVIRQINTYQEYYGQGCDCVLWVLATLEPLNEHEEKLLAAERIKPIVLTSFNAWVSSLNTTPSKNSLSI